MRPTGKVQLTPDTMLCAIIWQRKTSLVWAMCHLYFEEKFPLSNRLEFQNPRKSRNMRNRGVLHSLLWESVSYVSASGPGGPSVTHTFCSSLPVSASDFQISQCSRLRWSPGMFLWGQLQNNFFHFQLSGSSSAGLMVLPETGCLPSTPLVSRLLFSG